MTLNIPPPVSFGKFYSLFQKYWHYVSQREIRYSTLEVFVKTHFIYEALEIEWEKIKWCLDELKWICSTIDVKDSMFDPDFFINNEWCYLNHVKNCYYMRN